MNEFILMGRITRDPEQLSKFREDTSTRATFTLAINRIGSKDTTDFVKIITWGRNADNLLKYTGKGCRILVKGHVQSSIYDDKAGKKICSTEFVADSLSFIDYKSTPNTDMKSTSNDSTTITDGEVW